MKPPEHYGKIKRYISKANATGRRKIRDDENPIQVLEKLELIKDGCPTWAALLLFRKEPQRFLSQANIHCGRFKEEIIVIDDRMIQGTLFEQIDEAMDFAERTALRDLSDLLIKNVLEKVGKTGRNAEYILIPTNPP